MKRFLNFLYKIEISPKVAPKRLLNVIKTDNRSITGTNLRYIMLTLDKDSITDISPLGCNFIRYSPLNENNIYRSSFLNELINIRESDFEVPGFNVHEINDMIEFICTS